MLIHLRHDWSLDELPPSPNSLELTCHASLTSPKLIATLTHFSYVAFLAIGLYETAWLAKRLWDAEAPSWCLFVTGAVLWLPAVGFVGYEFVRRARDIPTLWRTR